MMRCKKAVLGVVCVMTLFIGLAGCGGGDNSRTSYWLWNFENVFQVMEMVQDGNTISGKFVESSNWIGTLSGAVTGTTYDITFRYSDGDARHTVLTLSGDTLTGNTTTGSEVTINKLDYSGLAKTEVDVSGIWGPIDATNGITHFYFQQLGNSVVMCYQALDHTHYGYGTISGDTISMTAYCGNNSQSAWSESWTSTLIDNQLNITWSTDRTSGTATIRRQ